jgi:predicted alpha/beta-fold hydrolase
MEESGNKKTLFEVLNELKEIPFRPNRLGGRMSTNVAFAADVLPMILDTQQRLACKLYPYPHHFQSVTFPSLDETPLAGKLALHRDGKARPALIVVHGIFGSKNNNVFRKVAIKAFRDWDYNVLAIDTRGFGESRLLSEAMATGGWKEGEDVVGAARFLNGFPEVTTVGVTGYSMGATAAMIAAGIDGGRYITGGVIGWNGTSDTRQAIEYISRRPMPWHPFFMTYPVFKACLALKVRDYKDYSGPADFASMFTYACKDCYAVGEEEGFEKASPGSYVANISIPTLHIHAEDDPVVEVSHARANQEKSKDNPNFEVWILRRGGHCAFSAVDNSWYQRVMQKFFAAWAVREQDGYGREMVTPSLHAMSQPSIN